MTAVYAKPCRQCGGTERKPRKGRMGPCVTCHHKPATKPWPTMEERFFSHVDTNGPVPSHRPELGPCHPWTGALNPDGYGEFSTGGRGSYQTLAPRVAFFIAEGRWPEPHALHHCDNPPCVRRSHLWEGDQDNNMKDAAAKGRCSNQRVTHCPSGHEYTPENTYTRPSRVGHERQCRTCKRAGRREAKLRAKLRAAGSRQAQATLHQPS